MPDLRSHILPGGFDIAVGNAGVDTCWSDGYGTARARYGRSYSQREAVQVDVVGDSASIISRRPLDYSGRSIGPLRLARAMVLNIVGGSSIAMALAVLWPPAVVTIIFLEEQLGASKTQIGLNLTLVILATAASLPGAWVFSRIQKRRRPWVALTTLARMFMFGPAVVALLAGREEWQPALIWIFMLCLFLVNAGSVFTSPGWWAWMADLIPNSMWGTFFGRRYRWMLLGQSVVMVATGRLLDVISGPEAVRMMFFGIFTAAAILAVADPLLFTVVPEPVRPRPPRQTLGDVVRVYLEPLRDRPFRTMLAAAGTYSFFWNMPLVFLVLFLRGEDVDGVHIGGRASVGLLSLVTVVFAGATALAANSWGRLADRIGHRIVYILGCFGYFTHLSFFFINEHNYAWIALVNAGVYGIVFSGQPVAIQNLAMAMAPRERREFYISMFQAVNALAAAMAPLFAGWLADRYRVLPGLTLPSGQPACYIHLILAIGFVGMVLVVPLMVRIPDAKGIEVRPWFGRLLSGDLWRMAWNIGVLGTASSVPRRVRALRRITPRDGNLMLPEILGALHDSDPAIRRESLLALGRLGTPEALELLLWYLHEPDAALRAHSVEAIGQPGRPEGSSLLKQALHDPDSRVRRAAVEALGRFGDREATTELRNLLADERDGEVLASAAVVLSRLKEFGAVQQMLKLALFSDNLTVRSQMLVALADLLGQGGDFPKLWRQDRHWRGSGFVPLAHKLRRQARVLARRDVAGIPRLRVDQRRLLVEMDNEVERLLEEVQEEAWPAAIDTLCRLAFQFLVLRYRYQGDEKHALEFLSAVSPAEAERYWLVTFLRHTCDPAKLPEAPWDGLTLLALYSLVHGQSPG